MFAESTCRIYAQICDSLENLKPSRNFLVPCGLGLALAIAIITPLVTSGWLLLLDNISGPHPDIPRGLYGLDSGVVQPLSLALYAINTIFGSIGSWLPLAMFFPLATVGAYRAVLIDENTNAAIAGKIGASLFYALTPIVFERLWVGQVGVLLGYALLPYMFRSMHFACRDGGTRWVQVALWAALSIALSPHYLWLSLVLICAMVITRQPSKRLYVHAGAALALIVLCSAYLISNANTGDSLSVNERDLAAYATQPEGSKPLIWTVATLQGFWRGNDPLQPANTFPGRSIVICVALLLIAVGLMKLRGDTHSLRGIFLAGLVSLLLAMGTQGPTGSLFQWAFDNLPGFAIMREPQKFAALWAFALAVAFGLGINKMTMSRRQSAHNVGRFGLAVAFSAAVVVPLALSPGIFWGFGGQLKASSYPESWKAADEVMGNGRGKVLALPWHQYSAFSFTSGRNIANPIPKVIRREMIVGDNVELADIDTASNISTSRFLTYLFDHGSQVSAFGALTAPLDVRYVFLSKSADWQKYTWLHRQQDLRIVFDDVDVTVFENVKWASDTAAVSSPLYVADWGELVGYVNATGDARGVMTHSFSPGVVRAPTTSEKPRLRSISYTKSSPVKYSFDEANPGESVLLPEAFHSGWHPSATKSALGTLMVSTDTSSAYFQPWTARIWLCGVSLFTFFALLCIQVRRSLLWRRTPNNREVS